MIKYQSVKYLYVSSFKLSIQYLIYTIFEYENALNYFGLVWEHNYIVFKTKIRVTLYPGTVNCLLIEHLLNSFN